LTCNNLDLSIGDESIENTRSIQKKGCREVLYYNNHCNMNKKPREKKLSGHFEKVDKKMTDYFYVSDDKPSGIPNAFVISPSEAFGN